MKDRIEALAEEIIQRHRIPDIVDSSVLYFEPDRDEIKEDIVNALQTIADEANKQGERTATGRAVKIAEEEIHKLRTIPKDKRPDAHTVLALVKRDIQNNVSK